MVLWGIWETEKQLVAWIPSLGTNRRQKDIPSGWQGWKQKEQQQKGRVGGWKPTEGKGS